MIALILTLKHGPWRIYALSECILVLNSSMHNTNNNKPKTMLSVVSQWESWSLVCRKIPVTFPSVLRGVSGSPSNACFLGTETLHCKQQIAYVLCKIQNMFSTSL